MDEPFELNHKDFEPWWAMTWPAALVGSAAFIVIAMTGHFTIAAIVSHAVFFSIKAMLIPRAIRRNYRTFWIGVVRGGEVSRDLNAREHAALVYVRILPGIALVVIALAISYWFDDRLSVGSLYAWGSDWNLPIHHLGRCTTGFRLQGYRRDSAMPHHTAA